jgi:hypothetical protein
VKYRSADSFRNDFRRLPAEHQRTFQEVVLRKYFLPAVAAGSFSGAPSWPARLRIHRLANTEIYSLTWNFSCPDGRATFISTRPRTEIRCSCGGAQVTMAATIARDRPSPPPPRVRLSRSLLPDGSKERVEFREAGIEVRAGRV